MIKGFFNLFPSREGERILIISEEADLGMLMRSFFLQRGFEVSFCDNISEANLRLKEYRPDIIFVTPTESADFAENLAELRRRAPDSNIMVDWE